MEKNKVKNLPLTAKDGGLAFSFMIIAYLLLSFFGQAIILAFCKKGSAVYTAISACLPAVALLSVTAYFAVSKKYNFTNLCNVKTFKPFALIPALLLSVGMFLGLGFVNGAFSSILKKAGLNVGGVSLPLENVGHLILFTIVFALLPAVCEELFFRGLMLTALKKVKVAYAAIYIAISFALYHCSMAQFIYQLIYGAGFTLLAIYAGSVIPCILVHFINNFAIIILEYFKVGVDLYNPILIVLGLVALFGFIAIILLSLKKREKKTDLEKNSAAKFYLPFGAFGSIICLILIIMNLLVV